MKIYLAGNYPLMQNKGRERKACEKFKIWRRLFSFYFVDMIYSSEIIDLVKESR